MNNIDAEQLQADLQAQFGAGFYQPGIGVPTAEQRAAFIKAQEDAQEDEDTDDGTKTVTNTSEFIRDGRRIKRTTYSDGTFDEEDLGESDDTGDGDTTIAGKEFDEDAYSRLTALLGRIGLEGLTSNIRELVAKGITDSDAILFELRGTTEYKTRFAGNAARAAKGLPELSPATYVCLLYTSPSPRDS